MPFYVPPEQMMKDRADYARKGIARGRSLVAFSATDEAVQYQSTITIGMRLVERATGRTIQDTPVLQESQDFGAESGVIISSSPHFQRGTINARDLTDLTNVQLGESRRRAAIRDLLDQLARDVYQHTMEGF